MALIHIVQFKFKPSVDENAIRSACDRMLSLKNNCIHPTSQETYIKSIRGGEDNSHEGFQNGFTHAFVVEFQSEEDRDYYVTHDEAHQQFIASIKDLVDGAQVLDFVPGKY